MSYEKTTWTNDAVKVNATNLNKIEQGIYDAHTNAASAQSTADGAATAASNAATAAANASTAAGNAQTAASNAMTAANSKYTKPASGIPESDLSGALVTKIGLKIAYPIVNSITEWGQEYSRDIAITPNVQLPTPTKLISEEIRFVFIALSAEATFSAPAGYIIAESDFSGKSTGNSYFIDTLTPGNMYEYSFIVLAGNRIGVSLLKEYVITTQEALGGL